MLCICAADSDEKHHSNNIIDSARAHINNFVNQKSITFNFYRTATVELQCRKYAENNFHFFYYALPFIRISAEIDVSVLDKNYPKTIRGNDKNKEEKKKKKLE